MISGMITLVLFWAAAPDFDRDIRPLFDKYCVRCHGGERLRAELDVRSRAALLKGGEGGPAVSPGSPERSLLWVHVAADRMPPGKEKLSKDEKETLRKWIESGAPGKEGPAPQAAPLITEADRAFWSFQPPKRPAVPSGADHPIDAFILAKLNEKGLRFSPEAERRVLIRRLTFDLIGLPPTLQEVEAFLHDSRPDAYERLVDRLLASPHHGERWGRHWLDVAGYADSEGILDADYVRSAAWRYRDYVIRAVNADRPYDRFLMEQIAGDELTGFWQAKKTASTLPAEVVEATVATGFLRCASDTSRPDFVNIKNAPSYYYQTLEDSLANLATATMGLTLHCAKCHAHKFDPIPHRDYYRMQSLLMGAYRPSQWIPQVNRRLTEATDTQEAENARQTAELKRLESQRATWLAKLTTGRMETQLIVLPLLSDLEQRIAEQRTRIKTFPEIRALYDLPGSVPTRILRRGDYLNPGDEVQPGVLSVLTTPEPFRYEASSKDAPTSGRRLAFAKWLTQPGHPLTARVFVNRVWMVHFGEGIVRTPENFGRGGALPTHSELLDWLAVDFANGWNVKQLHRLIVTSAAYRQESKRTTIGEKIDPDNRLLWRQRLRRLDAEPLRDAMLAVSGLLKTESFGPPVPLGRNGEGEVAPTGPGAMRRSVYLQVRRSQPVTVLQLFDQPVIETNCVRRSTSTVPSQALALLNGDFAAQCAAALAERAARESPTDPASQAFAVAFGRPTTQTERVALRAFAEKGGTLADLCQMILSANGFSYID